MKFRKLELENFRQFYGEQVIEFSTDKHKNITLIHAENGTGKTALLNAILWCFFGDSELNFKDPQSIINNVAKREGKKNYKVAMEFEDDAGELVFVQRAHSAQGISFKVFVNKDGSYSPIRNGESFINSIIPKDMAKYFFFQGEGIRTVSGSNRRGGSEVKEAVKKVLGFTVAEMAIDDLRKIKREYRTALADADKGGQLEKLSHLQIDLEESLEVLQKRVSGCNQSIDLFTTKLDQADEKLKNSNSEVVKGLHSQRSAMLTQRDREEQRLRRAQAEKLELISDYAISIFGFRLSNFVLDFINEDEYKSKIPEPFDKQLVEDILSEGRCICGTAVELDSQEFDRIKSLLGKAADPNLRNRVASARSQLTRIRDDAVRAKKKFSENMDELGQTETALGNLKGQLSELSIKIEGTEEIENIADIERERRRIAGSLDEEKRSKILAEAKIEELEKELKRAKFIVSKLGAFTPQVKKFKKLADLTETIEKKITATLSESEKYVEHRIIEKVNKYLEEFVRQDYSAKLDPASFEIRLIDKNSQIVPESDGQALLLSLTFIASLIELSRERKNATGEILTPGAIAPFVIDAPFGELDDKYKGNISSAIPNSVDQVIFLLSSSAWSGSVEKNIREKVGLEYNMVLEESSSIGSKTNDPLVILDNDYDTVRYDMPLDRTVVERVASYV